MSETTESLNLSDRFMRGSRIRSAGTTERPRPHSTRSSASRSWRSWPQQLIPFLAALNTYHKAGGGGDAGDRGAGRGDHDFGGDSAPEISISSCGLSYRSTCEGLKHEKFTYLGHAEPYASAGRSACPAHRARGDRCSRRKTSGGLQPAAWQPRSRAQPKQPGYFSRSS